jgi:hypothetical protein
MTGITKAIFVTISRNVLMSGVGRGFGVAARARELAEIRWIGMAVATVEIAVYSSARIERRMLEFALSKRKIGGFVAKGAIIGKTQRFVIGILSTFIIAFVTGVTILRRALIPTVDVTGGTFQSPVSALERKSRGVMTETALAE